MKTVEHINKSIKTISTTGAKLDKLIQDTLVDVAEHFAEHKDTGLVNRLYVALPRGVRATAAADWLLKFVAVKPNTDQANKKTSPFLYDKEKTTNALEGAKVFWYDLKKDKAVDEAFDVMTAVRGMLRKIEKSTNVEHYDADAQAAMKALAKAVGIPESDVPTKAAIDPLTVEDAPV